MQPRFYTTTTGEQMFLPEVELTREERRAANLAAMRAELRQLNAEWDETAEQLLTLQNRRRKISERRRSLTRIVGQADALAPFTPQETN